MSEASNNEREQLLMAYLDGELGAEERSQVESLIEANSDYASLVEKWREHGNLIRTMSKYSLDEGFADRVLAIVESGESAHPTALSGNQAEDSTYSELGSDTGTNWRFGAAAIATLAAMLLLTLFVFPANDDQPSVAVNVSPDEAVENSNDGKLQPKSESSKIDSDKADGKTGPPAGHDSGTGPSRPVLNKNLEGKGGKPALESKDLVPPFRVPDRSSSVEQVLWVDMNSHSTALADIEAVLLKNSMTILRADAGQEKMGADTIQGSQNRLVQRSNSRFEALHVIATRSQVKNAIIELSSQYHAKFQAITLPTIQEFFQPAFDSHQTSENSGNAGPNGRVPHLTRNSNSPKRVKGSPGLATVRQILPSDLIPDGLNPSETVGDSAQVPDAAEIRQLHEWFGLAEKEDKLSVVRFLLLVDTSPNESDRSDNGASSDDQ